MEDIRVKVELVKMRVFVKVESLASCLWPVYRFLLYPGLQKGEGLYD